MSSNARLGVWVVLLVFVACSGEVTGRDGGGEPTGGGVEATGGGVEATGGGGSATGGGATAGGGEATGGGGAATGGGGAATGGGGASTGQQTLTITGTGFGNGPTYVLADKTIGADGADIPDRGPQIGVYAGPNPGAGPDRPRYRSYAGRTWLAERRTPPVEDGARHMASLKFEFNSTAEFRVSYRQAVPPGKRWPASAIDGVPNTTLSHHKPVWLGVDSAPDDGIQANDNANDIVICSFPGGASRLTGGNTTGGSGRWYNGFTTNSMTAGTQTWVSWYEKFNEADDAMSVVHQMAVNENAFHNVSKVATVKNGHEAHLQKFYDVALIPGWYGNVAEPAAASPRDFSDVDPLMTDITISVGPESGKLLLLGDAPVLSQCTRVYEVVASSWNDTRIEAAVEPWEALSHYFVMNRATVIQSGPTQF